MEVRAREFEQSLDVDNRMSISSRDFSGEGRKDTQQPPSGGMIWGRVAG